MLGLPLLGNEIIILYKYLINYLVVRKEYINILFLTDTNRIINNCSKT